MKRTVCILMASIMLFCLCSCKSKNPYENYSYEEISSAVASQDKGIYNFICYYSINNEDTSDDEVFVSFPMDVYDEEKDVFYTADGDSILTFYGEKKFYDKKTGKPVNEEDIAIGQSLEVSYSGKAESSKPAVIKAYKVYVLDLKG